MLKMQQELNFCFSFHYIVLHMVILHKKSNFKLCLAPQPSGTPGRKHPRAESSVHHVGPHLGLQDLISPLPLPAAQDKHKPIHQLLPKEQRPQIQHSTEERREPAHTNTCLSKIFQQFHENNKKLK